MFSCEFWKFLRTPFLKEHLRKLLLLFVIYLFNYDSSKSTFFMLNMAFCVLLSTVLVKWITILRFLFFVSFSCKIKLQEHRSFCSVLSYVLFCKNLIGLRHDDNNFLFYFNICIKFTLSTITSRMKKWQYLTWCVLWNNFFMIKISCSREKKQ